MVNGLPGTGIGGLFYLLLAALMPLREGVRALRGRSRGVHWRFIGMQWALIGCVLFALWGQGWLLKELFATKAMQSVAAVVDPTGVMNRPMTDYATIATSAALYSLAGVMIAVEILRLVVMTRARREIAPSV